MNDKVDIILATYNGEKYVTQQIESILTQTHANFHLYIKDDASTDQTKSIIEEIAKQYPEIITIIPSKKNRGIIGNFSDLMQASTANYLMFSDQDDIWLPEKVSKTLYKMKSMEWQYGSSTPLLVHTDLQVVDENLKLINPSFWNYSKLDPEKGNALNRLLVQNVVTGCTMMLNKELVELSQPLPEAIIMHDWWIALVAALVGKIDYLEETTILYRQHNKNQVGAKQASFFAEIPKYFSNIEMYMSKLQSNMEKQKQQATLLLERYDTILDSTHCELLHAFCQFRQTHLLEKILLMLRYRFYKHGLLRNLRDLTV